eukprot:g4023.t1
MVDSSNHARIRYERVNADTGEEVPWDRMVKGYEHEDGKFILLSSDELESVQPELTKTIEIDEFVELSEIDPILFDKPYYLEPEKRGRKAYALLREALRKSGKAGISKVVIRTREYLSAMFVRDDVLVLMLLRFPQEVKKISSLELPSSDEKEWNPVKKEMDLALRLIGDMTEKWNPEEIHDEYRESLMAYIEKKISKGDSVSDVKESDDGDIPKNIPEDTSEKRLAVHVEDHPLEYGGFEGEIPKGNYGAGKVEIWDSGEWQPLAKNWKKDFGKGKLKFTLRGKRLEGTYLLARMGEEPNWLLRRLSDDANELPPAGIPREPTSFVEPQLARVVSSVPSGREWCHEIKFDGYRLIAVKTKGQVSLFTRNGHDWTGKFGDLPDEISKISGDDFVLDGEAVIFDDDGRTTFGGLQQALKEDPQEVVFVAFDLLNHSGGNLRGLPLSQRIARLESILPEDGPRVRRSRVWPGSAGKELFKQACGNGLEGIISKKLNARYLPGTRRDWVKSKCRARQEFVICGYTPPKGSRSGFGALVLGSFDNGKLIPRGKVGTGFNEKQIREMMKRFAPLEITDPLFPTSEKEVTWLRPELVAEIEFAEITRDGSIRQGSFLGVREDKAPESIHLESASPARGSEVLGIMISHPDRIVYPDTGITKLEVARYYEQVGDLMMPYVADRPLAILRAPGGVGGDLFFQKSFPNYLPAEVKQQQLPEGSTVFSVSGTKGLVSLAQFGAMEFHPWGSTTTKPEIAEFLTWDLDPDPAVVWQETLGAAFLLRDFLQDLGLAAMVKTSGGKGLHLMVRIRRVHGWDVMKTFAKDVSRHVAAMNPGRFVIEAPGIKIKTMPTKDHSARHFYVALGRAAGGSILFSVPMLMTMEMWWLGFYMHPLRLALMVLLSIPLLAGLAYFSGFEERLSLRGAVVDALVAYAVGLLTSAAILLLFAIIRIDMSPMEIAGKVTLQAIPAGMGAVLASSQMGGKKRTDRPGRVSSYWGELFLMLAGALFLSFNMAPTEEMVVIAHMMSAWHTLLLVFLTLLVMHAFVYKLEFHGQETHPEFRSWWAVFSRFTIAGYGIALLVSYYCLWSFGRNEGNDITLIVSQTVVLGFPSAIGAASARLLI